MLWALATDAPAVVVEGNFLPRDPYQRAKLAALAVRPVEVYCDCPPELAARRYDQREVNSHPVHVVTSVPPGARAEFAGQSASGTWCGWTRRPGSTRRRSRPLSGRTGRPGSVAQRGRG